MFLQVFPSGWTNALKKVICLRSNPTWIWVWSQSICLPLEFVAIQKKGSCCIFPSNVPPFGDRSLLSQHQLNVLLEHQSQIVKLTEPAELRITQLSFISRLCLLLWSSKREQDLLRLEQIYLKPLFFSRFLKMLLVFFSLSFFFTSGWVDIFSK